MQHPVVEHQRSTVALPEVIHLADMQYMIAGRMRGPDCAYKVRQGRGDQGQSVSPDEVNQIWPLTGTGEVPAECVLFRA